MNVWFDTAVKVTALLGLGLNVAIGVSVLNWMIQTGKPVSVRT